MSFFTCSDGLKAPNQSEPTIPLILRGKRKTNQKAGPPQSETKIPRQSTHNITVRHSPLKINGHPIEIHNDIRINLPPPIIIQRPLFSHVRSVSLPRPNLFHRVPTAVAPHPPHPIIQASKPVPIQNKQKFSGPAESLTGQNIRKCLDENLNIVYKDLSQRRQSQNFQIKHNLSTQIYRPKLQQNLVQEYIKLIYRDYALPDPMEKYSPLKRSTETGQENIYSEGQSISTEPHKNKSSEFKRRGQGSTAKKAVKLKQSFLVEMFSPKQIQQGISQQRHRSQSFSGQQENHLGNLTSPFMHLEEISEAAYKEIKQTYRYCFICQQPILQANISVHERERCPEFCNLYEMNLSELKEALIRKILRIRKQTEQIHEILFGEKNENLQVRLSSLKKQGKRYLSTIDTNIKIPENEKGVSSEIWKDEVKKNFKNVMNCYEDDYFKMYQNFRKLQWFVLMLKNLQEKYCSNSADSLFVEAVSKEIQKNTRETEAFDNRRFSLGQ